MTNSSYSDQGDSSGFVAGLAVGLVLGAGGAYYLNSTKQGKELLEQLKLKAGEALEAVKDSPHLADKIADLQKTMDKARATINDAAEKVVEATEPTKPAPKKNFFQKMGASLGK